MTIQLYNNTSEKNRVDKTAYLALNMTLNGTLRSGSSIVNPIITIELEKDVNIPDFNYAYIPEFSRYYFINDIISITNVLWEIHMNVDVLYTYKEGILNCTAFVERSESLSNPMLIDKKRIVEQGFFIEEEEIENNIFDFPKVQWKDHYRYYAMTGMITTKLED